MRWESQNGSFFNLKFDNINFLRVRKQRREEELLPINRTTLFLTLEDTFREIVRLVGVFPNFKIPSENLTSLGKKHDFRQKVNIMTARLQEARVIPSKYNGIAVAEITHIYFE